MTATRQGRAHRAVRVLAGLTGALLLAGLPAAASADEPREGSCPVVAAAQGMQVTVGVSDNLLLNSPAGVGIPVAQACVDYGVRDSSAFASSPYPGETVILAPGLVANRIGQPVPGYPAYAASRAPAKEHAEAEQPGYSLRADSTETTSKARARSAIGPEGDGPGATLATAESVVDPETAAATATGTSDTQPMTINEELRLGQIHSVATAEVGQDGKLRRSSDLTIGRTTVGGQEVVITPDGLRVAAETVGLPETPPADVLEEAGIAVRYLAAEQTARGVMSAGIEVTARQQDPESGTVTTVRYTLGRAFASAAVVEQDAGGGELDLAPPVGGTDAAAPPASGSGSGPSDSDDTADPPSAAAAPESAEAPADEAPPPETASPNQLAANPVDMGASALYLVLMFGALVMVAGATLLRLLGVKTRWTS